MKQKIAIGIVLFVCMQVGMAQDKVLRMGSRITLGQSELIGNSFSGKLPGLYMGIGGSADYGFNKFFGIMGDAMLMRKSFKIQGVQTVGILNEEKAYTDKFHFYQAEVPVMGKITLGGERFRFRAFAGPVLAFNFLTLQSREYDDDAYNEDNGYYSKNMQNVNIFEQGLVYGIGLEVKAQGNGIFFADLRSGRNLTPSANYAGKDVYFRYFNISLGMVY